MNELKISDMKNVVITGDSMSYNRYDYDKTPRIEATDCYIGMQSWSFQLRNYIIASSKGFKYADELEYSCNAVKGADSENELDAIFADRVRTLYPEGNEIRFKVNSKSGKIVLYIQNRPVNYCRFSVKIDDKVYPQRIDTYANASIFHGFDLMAFEFMCDIDTDIHEVIFFDFEYADAPPRVTLAGVSEERKNINITGQGSRTTKFMLYHYEDRIKKYSPELLILIIGANDISAMTAEEFHINLDKLLNRTKTDFPNCKIITFTLTVEREDKDKVTAFNTITKELTKKYDGITIDFDTLFEGIVLEEWRYDNVHLNKNGNNILVEKLKNL